MLETTNFRIKLCYPLGNKKFKQICQILSVVALYSALSFSVIFIQLY